jgi:hypothetical protein
MTTIISPPALQNGMKTMMMSTRCCGPHLRPLPSKEMTCILCNLLTHDGDIVQYLMTNGTPGTYLAYAKL